MVRVALVSALRVRVALVSALRVRATLASANELATALAPAPAALWGPFVVWAGGEGGVSAV